MNDDEEPKPTLPRLVQWASLEFRISGERIARLVGEEIAKQKAPVTNLEFEFADDLIRVDGRIRKAIAIPFTVEVVRIGVEGSVVRVPLHKAAAFGIPIPSFLMTIAQFWLHSSEVTYASETKSVLIKLDRFLPPFADVTIEQIRPVAGGIAVRLGPGGADPPASGGTKDGHHGE